MAIPDGQDLQPIPNAVPNQSPAPIPNSVPTAVPTPAPSPAPSAATTFGQKFAQAAGELGVSNTPGGWARSLVGAAIKTLGATGNVVSNAVSGLQDAATGPVTPGGSGALEGITQTLKNRQNRQDQQAITMSELGKNAAMTAHENATMLHEQMLTSQLGEEANQKMIAQGKLSVANLTEGTDNPGQILLNGLTSDEMKTQLATGKINPTQVHVYPTGEKVVGENPDGSPIMRTTYSVVSDPPSVKLNDSQAAFLNKYLPHLSATGVQTGQELTGAQYGLLTQQAASVQAATAARNKLLSDQDIANDDEIKKMEIVSFGGTDWNKALAQAKNDPVGALILMQSDPGLVQKYPHLYQDAVQAYGGQTAWNEYLKSRDEAIKQARENDPVLKLSTPENLERPGAVAAINAAINDPNTKPGDIPRLRNLIGQANAAQKAASVQKNSEEAAKQALTDGDPKAAAQLLVGGFVAPAQLISSRKPEFAQQAFTEARKLDPNFSPQKADADYNIAKSPANTAFFGSANSLLDHGGTLDQVLDQYSKLPNGQIPKLNSIADWASAATGQSPASGFAQTAIGVADDYAKVMGGGTGSDNARMAVLKTFAAAQSPQQMQAAVDAARNAVKSQVKSRIGQNSILQKMYGENVPQQPANDPFAQFGGRAR